MLLQTLRSSRRALQDPAPRELQLFHRLLQTRKPLSTLRTRTLHTTEKELFTATSNYLPTKQGWNPRALTQKLLPPHLQNVRLYRHSGVDDFSRHDHGILSSIVHSACVTRECRLLSRFFYHVSIPVVQRLSNTGISGYVHIPPKWCFRCSGTQ